KVHVVGDKQVKKAVAVVIQPGRAGAPARVIHTRRACDIREGPITVVVVEHVRAEVRDIEVLKSVVVVVAHGYAHAAADPPHARLLGNVFKLQLPGLREQIAKEPVAGPPSRRRRENPILIGGERKALYKVTVKVAVVVV